MVEIWSSKAGKKKKNVSLILKSAKSSFLPRNSHGVFGFGQKDPAESVGFCQVLWPSDLKNDIGGCSCIHFGHKIPRGKKINN